MSQEKSLKLIGTGESMTNDIGKKKSYEVDLPVDYQHAIEKQNIDHSYINDANWILKTDSDCTGSLPQHLAKTLSHRFSS